MMHVNAGMLAGLALLAASHGADAAPLGPPGDDMRGLASARDDRSQCVPWGELRPSAGVSNGAHCAPEVTDWLQRAPAAVASCPEIGADDVLRAAGTSCSALVPLSSQLSVDTPVPGAAEPEFFSVDNGIRDAGDGDFGADLWASHSTDVSIVPLPAAGWLFAGALGVLRLLRRRSNGENS